MSAPFSILRFRFRFTLRLFLALVTLAAIAFAWPAGIVRQAAIERSIVASLPDGRTHSEWIPAGPKWLRQIVGEERCQSVQALRIRGATPRSLERLRHLSRLESLAITHCDLRDADIERLGVLKTVKQLKFQRTAIGDASIEMLVRYPLLESCDLTGTQVSPAAGRRLYEAKPACRPQEGYYPTQWAYSEYEAAGIQPPMEIETGDLELAARRSAWPQAPRKTDPEALLAELGERRREADDVETLNLYIPTQVDYRRLRHIAALPRLQKLSLYQTWTTDLGLAALAEQPTIEALDLWANEYTAAGVRFLPTMPKLRSLRIHGRGIRNEAAAALSHCEHLESLDLHGANITSDALPALARMPSLEWLSLRGTNVSNRGIEELLKLPKLQRLYLDGSFVNADGARRLAELKSLKVLELGGEIAGLSPAERDELRALMPNVIVRVH